MLSCSYWLLRKKELIGFFLKTFTTRGKNKFTIKLDYGTVFFLMPKVNYCFIAICKLAFSKGAFQSEIWLLVLLSLSWILQRTHPVSVGRFLEICVCWMCVIHDFFPVAPLAVMPFDNVAVGWWKNTWRSSLLSGWLCPFKINFRKRFSILTCFPKGKGVCWHFWATIKSSRVTSV